MKEPLREVLIELFIDRKIMTIEDLIKLPQIRFQELQIGKYFIADFENRCIFTKYSQHIISCNIAYHNKNEYQIVSYIDQDIHNFQDFVIPLDSAQIELFLNTEKAKKL